jgi:hypothetical protein
MTEMTKTQRQELADYYDTHDTTPEMEGGEWVDEPATDPMVTTSLRLPLGVMRAVRAAAAAEKVKPTALIRRWVEDALSGQPTIADPVKADLAGLSFKMDRVLGLLGDIGSTAVVGIGAGRTSRPTKTAPTKKATKAAATKKAMPSKTAAKKATTKRADQYAPAAKGPKGAAARSTTTGRFK